MDDTRRKRILAQLQEKGCAKAQAFMFIKAFDDQKMDDAKIESVLGMVDFRVKTQPDESKKRIYQDIDSLVAEVVESDISSIQNVTSGIIKIMNEPRSTAADLKKLIEVDPPLTAKVLRIANSAKFFTKEPICTIERAVIWIGFENLKEITLNQKVCEIFQKADSPFGFSRMALWKHCVAVAMLCKMIFRRELGKPGENIYAAGLLHDIGIIAEDQFLEAPFTEVLKRAATGEPFKDAERAIFGFDHSDVGGRIALQWKIPPDTAEAILKHHNPLSVTPGFEESAFTLHVADCLCTANGIGYSRRSPLDAETCQKCLNALGIKRHAVEMIADDMLREFAAMEKEDVFGNV